MRFLKNIFDSLEPKFKDGGFLERLYPVFEATEKYYFLQMLKLLLTVLIFEIVLTSNEL